MTTTKNSSLRFLRSLSLGDSGIFALALLFLKLVENFPRGHFGSKSDLLPTTKDTLDSFCLFVLRNSPTIGTLINQTLAFSCGFDNQLQDALRTIDFTSYQSEDIALSTLLEKINETDTGSDPADLFDQAIETVVGNGYRFTVIPTPDFISELMVNLVVPNENDSVYDPVCGTGGLLLKAYERVPGGTIRLYGQEIDPQVRAICLMRLFLRGIVQPRIACGDVFLDPAHTRGTHLMKFQVALLDPPFALSRWTRGNTQQLEDRWNRFGWGIPFKSDFAFLQHTVKCLDEKTGRMAIILPFGALTHGRIERDIREMLVTNNFLDAVVCLPEKMYTNTSISLCVLVIKMKRDRKDVMFIDASGDEQYEKRRSQNVLRMQDIDRIVRAYTNRETVEGYSCPVAAEELKKNNFNLNIARYIAPVANESPVPLESLEQEIVLMESELAKIRKTMREQKIRAEQ